MREGERTSCDSGWRTRAEPLQFSHEATQKVGPRFPKQLGFQHRTPQLGISIYRFPQKLSSPRGPLQLSRARRVALQPTAVQLRLSSCGHLDAGEGPWSRWHLSGSGEHSRHCLTARGAFLLPVQSKWARPPARTDITTRQIKKKKKSKLWSTELKHLYNPDRPKINSYVHFSLKEWQKLSERFPKYSDIFKVYNLPN